MSTQTESSATDTSTARRGYVWDMASNHKPPGENLQGVDIDWWNSINQQCGDLAAFKRLSY